MNSSRSPASRNELQARGGAVATPHRHAAAAAQQVLDSGGNAVDAAVAAVLALCVVIPSSVGLGGYGGSMVVYLAKQKRVIALDFDSRGPLRYRPELFADPAAANFGYLAVTVPAVLAGLDRALREFGTISFSDAAEPAEKLAREGFVLDTKLKRQLDDWRGRTDPASIHALFPDGNIPEPRKVWVQNDLANLIQTLRKQGPGAFYHGEIPQKIIRQIQAHGGILCEEDFSAYQPQIVEPTHCRYRGVDVYTPPPPSGGITSLQTLKTLETFDVASMTPWGAPYLHVLAEAMKLSWADRARYLGDPDFTHIPVEQLLSSESAVERAKHISLNGVGQPVTASDTGGAHTVNVCAVDRDRNVVSLTATQGFLFGSQVVIDGLGLVLGHGMSRFDFKPGSPNEPAAGKRMHHNMSPTIMLRDGRPYRAFGMPGGPKIVNVATQLIVNTVDFKQSPGDAIMAPRIHTEGTEPLLITNSAKDTFAILEKMGHQLQREQTVGGPANMIEISEDGESIIAASGNGVGAIASK